MMKHFFLKRLFQYMRALAIPVLILMGFILTAFSIINVTAIRRESESAVERTQKSVDTLVSDAIYQHDLIASNPRLALAMRRLLSRSGIDYNNYIYANSMAGIMHSVANAHPYIQSTYLQLDGYDSFYSTYSGVQQISSYADQSWYEIIPSLEQNGKYAILREIKIDSFSPERKVITFYRRMTTLRGTIIVNINYDNFRERLDLLPSMPAEALCIVNTDRSIIAATTKSMDLSAAEKNALSSLLERHEAGMTAQWLKLGSRHFWISAAPDASSGLTCVSLIPMRAFWQNMRLWMLLSLAVILVAVLASLQNAYSVTSDSFSHIQEIIDLFSAAEKGIYPQNANHPIRDEYDIILMNVLQLFLNTTFLNSQLQSQRYQREAAELAALQLQISPHFMSNTLQTLDFESRRLSGGQPTTMTGIISDLSDILRYSLASPTSRVSLKEEMDCLRKYMNIQHYRFGDQIIFYTELDDDAGNALVPRLILQPLAENSIAHGILPSGRRCCIKVRAFVRDARLKISVIDTGIGMSKEQIAALYRRFQDPDSQNIGLTNVNRRLVLNYDENAALRIQSSMGSCSCISFSIPYRSAAERSEDHDED